MDKKDLENENVEEEKLNNIPKEPDNVTREINLDELYDGALNNTVVIDPVTNNEILLSSKKTNHTFWGIFFAIIILLVLYYVNNKSTLINKTKEVKPNKTTTKEVITSSSSFDKGTLNCTYNAKSDSENQMVTYTANFEEGKVINSNFNYVVVSVSDVPSAVVQDLTTQYENLFINNASSSGNNITFEKNEKGFTFNSKVNYQIANYDLITIVDGQNVLYVKPTKEDTIDSLKQTYTEKGFTCSILNSD